MTVDKDSLSRYRLELISVSHFFYHKPVSFRLVLLLLLLFMLLLLLLLLSLLLLFFFWSTAVVVFSFLYLRMLLYKRELTSSCFFFFFTQAGLESQTLPRFLPTQKQSLFSKNLLDVDFGTPLPMIGTFPSKLVMIPTPF